MAAAAAVAFRLSKNKLLAHSGILYFTRRLYLFLFAPGFALFFQLQFAATRLSRTPPNA